MQGLFHRVSMCFLLLLMSAGVLFGQDSKAEPSYQDVWEKVSELIRRREYASALSELDSQVNERDLRRHVKQIEEDRKAIGGLQTLERLVHERAAKLSGGDSLELSGIQYVFVRYDSQAKNSTIVMRSKATDKEVSKPISELPASTWIQIVGPRLDELSYRPLVLGIFLGFDRTADRKAARKHLDDAARDGTNVTTWLSRLDDQESRQKEAAADRKDPLVGDWLVQMPTKDGARNMNVDFRSNGTCTSTLTPQSRAKVLKNNPRSNVPLGSSGKWNKGEDGTYNVTFSGGMTWELTVTDNEHFDAKMPGGRPLRGVRQVKK